MAWSGVFLPINHQLSTINLPLQPSFPQALFAARGLFVLAGFVFAVALANLLFHFFRDLVNGRVEIILGILGKKIRAAHRQPHGTGKLLLRDARVVMFERHAGINRPAIEVLKLVEPGQNMVFDGFGERHIMRREDQFHRAMMLSARGKIQ